MRDLEEVLEELAKHYDVMLYNIGGAWIFHVRRLDSVKPLGKEDYHYTGITPEQAVRKAEVLLTDSPEKA